MPAAQQAQQQRGQRPPVGPPVREQALRPGVAQQQQAQAQPLRAPLVPPVQAHTPRPGVPLQQQAQQPVHRPPVGPPVGGQASGRAAQQQQPVQAPLVPQAQSARPAVHPQPLQPSHERPWSGIVATGPRQPRRPRQVQLQVQAGMPGAAQAGGSAAAQAQVCAAGPTQAQRPGTACDWAVPPAAPSHKLETEFSPRDAITEGTVLACKQAAFLQTSIRCLATAPLVDHGTCFS